MDKDHNLPSAQYRYVHELIEISAPLSQQPASDPNERVEIVETDLQHAEGEKAKRLRRENNQLKVENQRLRRAVYLSASLVVLAVGIVVGARMRAPTWAIIGACVAWAAICIEGIKWVKDTSVSALGFILAVGATVAWTVLAGVLAIVFSQSAAPHSTRGHTPVRPSAASAPVRASMQAAAAVNSACRVFSDSSAPVAKGA
jgi:hypothetical protein